MDFPPFSGFYPQPFSWRLDASMGLGALCAGLTLVSATAEHPRVSFWLWLLFSAGIYVFAGFYYARRSGNWSGKKNQVIDWAMWILCLYPMLVAWGLTALLWAAGGLATQPAAALCLGAFGAVFAGPLLMFGVMLICHLINLWMEQPQPNS